MAFKLNSDLYKDPRLTEGVDYARRHRRHERFDDSLAPSFDLPKTTILAPHGGGIERGTSELCLAVAGYHPANLPQTPPAGVTYDYWMFEGVREDDNALLHVPSIGCDDQWARSLCAGACNALALHGFEPKDPLPPDAQRILVGGKDIALHDLLLAGFEKAGLQAVDATQGELDGDDDRNIVNKTRKGEGTQLELSTPLRDAMFTDLRRSRRKHTTTQLFWTFVAVCRDAIDRREADQVVL